MKTRPVRDFTDEVCQPFFLQGGRHGVLLIHGFTGSAAHMRPLGEALHARGYTVEGINLPGHAQSMEAMARSTWQDWLEAAKAAFLRLQERCELVSVAGLSMGGCLSLILAEQMHPVSVTAISAPMAVQNKLLPLTKIAAPLLPRIYWRSREGAAHPLDDRYDYGYPGFPTRCGADLNRLIRMARQDLHAVQCPVLVVQSRHDETISKDSADVIIRGVGSSVKGTLWLENVPHVCTITHECPRIADAMAQLLARAEQRA